MRPTATLEEITDAFGSSMLNQTAACSPQAACGRNGLIPLSKWKAKDTPYKMPNR